MQLGLLYTTKCMHECKSALSITAEPKLKELQKQVSSQGAQLQKAELDVRTARSSEEALQQSVVGLKTDVEASQYVQGFMTQLHILCMGQHQSLL